MLRVRFTKTGLSSFLSHLDLMRTMERALRRAALPMAYTAGFNPRPRLSFGPALPVGTASLAEYLDVELQDPVDPEVVPAVLNPKLPAGIEITGARLLEHRRKSLAAAICLATYEVAMEECGRVGVLEETVEQVLGQAQWVVPRSRDRAPGDIRGHISDLVLLTRTPTVRLHLALRMGPAGAVRPEEVLNGMAIRCGGCFDPVAVSITRTGLFAEVEGCLVPPWRT
ncbi:MAG: TIGR03936 family radical SAM-associated protein [Bacillota bacterium]